MYSYYLTQGVCSRSTCCK